LCSHELFVLHWGCQRCGSIKLGMRTQLVANLSFFARPTQPRISEQQDPLSPYRLRSIRARTFIISPHTTAQIVPAQSADCACRRRLRAKKKNRLMIFAKIRPFSMSCIRQHRSRCPRQSPNTSERRMPSSEIKRALELDGVEVDPWLPAIANGFARIQDLF